MRFGVKQERDWNALDDETFRAIVREEFERHYPAELRYPAHRLRWSRLRDWVMHTAAKGWIAPAWPVEFGGMGLEPAKLLIFLEEQERWGIARYQDHGILMIGPLLMRYGTQAQRERYLPPILAAQHIWCQGYSEPEAGSDLASLRTTAVRRTVDGRDGFVIDGQKIWTTMAHDSTHIFVLARTDPDVKKQQGISFFLVELGQPGIRVRPIRDLTGHEEFAEVFFDGVFVGEDSLVGELNQGWTVAKSLLGFERISLGSPKFCEYGLQQLVQVARLARVDADPAFLDRLAELQLDVAHLGDAYLGFAEALIRGQPLGHEVSLLKIWSTETFQRIADLAMEVAGPLGGLSGPVEMANEKIDILAFWHKARPATIYGGSNEIQRNILARQVLNLPSD
ncbi:acyl-CoA dehydrogenase family protein [Alcaligenaceae bacterium]|nr:acyl-CoA dehydrogenase family protein [Alcaligenaceae bacterium]